jgi:hypothetical protein
MERWFSVMVMTLARWNFESGVSRIAIMVPGCRAAVEMRSWCGGGGLFVARKGRTLMMVL